MLARDLGALRALVRFTPTPCVINPEGLGAPPTCRDGEAAGTAVDVLPIAQCEGFFSRPDELNLDGLLLGLDGVPSVAINLYAAYRAPADVFPPGKYFVIFSARAPGATDAPRGFALTMSDEGVTGIHHGCAQTPAQMVEFQRLTDAIVAPPTTSTRESGIASVDAAISVVLAGDFDAFLSLVRYTPTACSTGLQQVGSPPPCKGSELDGTLVDVLPVAYCEGIYLRPEDVSAERIELAGATLYAVYRTANLRFPEGDFVAVFSRRSEPPASPPQHALSLVLTNEGITGIYYGCAPTTEGAVAGISLSEPILPPQ